MNPNITANHFTSPSNARLERGARRARRLITSTALVFLCITSVCIPARAEQKRIPARNADAPAADAASSGDALFNGKDFTGWKFRTAAGEKVWSIAEVGLDPADPKKLGPTNTKHLDGATMFRDAGRGCDIYTEKTFGDCQVHVEFMIPDGSNSGVYLMGEYEVQILSTYGKPDAKLGPGDCGGIYHTHAPLTNALLPYGQWNSYDITFRAPRFDASGKKIENARFIEVFFNGKKIHENVEPKGPTGGELPGGEKPAGPLLLQGDHGICAFRNLRIKTLDLK